MLAIYRLLAFLLDLWLADPPNWPHPVKFYGRFIRGYERVSQFDKKKPMTQTFLGGVLVFLLLIHADGIGIKFF
ncbi:cobalamin biosynthesis protein [Aerococcus urinae]